MERLLSLFQNQDVIIKKIESISLQYGINILFSLFILIIGLILAKLITVIITKIMAKRNVDHAITSFTVSVSHAAIVVFVLISALSKLGIETASLVAAIGAAGLAIGLSLQGSLSNFASGFLLVILHPFRAGDYIMGGGVEGTVEKLGIFTTNLVTRDNKLVIVPNAKLTSDNIINYSMKGIRRIDLTFGVSYSDDIDKVKSILEDIVTSDERILKSPEHFIGLHEMADSSVNFVVRPWCHVQDYWNIYFDLQEKVKKAFDANDVTIPFPQRDVHLYTVDQNKD